MAPRSRALAFGSAAALVVAGALCAAVIGGLTGQVLAITLITVGLGGALLLLFLEVGLSEDRARAREEERRRRRAAGRVGWPRSSAAERRAAAGALLVYDASATG